MRFMMLVMPKGNDYGPPDELPVDRVETMMAYNESLQKAGVLLALDGLHPPSTGFRVTRQNGQNVVADGPFSEAKEVVGGYWVIDVRSKEEALEWARRCPISEDEILEVRQVQQMEDFSPEVQDVAKTLPEMQSRRATQ